MRSFTVALCALAASAAAQSAPQDTISYDATVYITSTITRINTITASSSPTGAPVNSTSTIVASHPTMAPSYNAGNGTAVAPTASPSAPTGTAPTGTAPGASQVPFPGAASSLSANAYLALVAAGLGYLVL
jgi:hypothetical protein